MPDRFTFKRAVVEFLSTADPYSLPVNAEEWNKNFRWLDRSGLALPVAAKLEQLRSPSPVPAPVAKALQLRLSDNEKRMANMLRQFAEINAALASSGARYCCVKGFSLIPGCFNDIRERHQVDLDFLISPADAGRAAVAVESLGYGLVDARSTGELRFSKPLKKHLGVNAWLYAEAESPVIELHTEVWEREADAIDFPELSGFLDVLDTHELRGIQFPCLQPDYQFIHLLLHVFRHLAGSWARLLSLYEVATLVRGRWADHALWEKACGIMLEDEAIASASALVLSLVSRVFAIRMPDALRKLQSTHLSPESSLWLESHADAWLFSEPPGNKLALLVQKQFCRDDQVWRQYILRRLVPFRNAPALSDGVEEAAKKTWAYRTENVWYKITRTWYHLRSGFEYLLARLRWERLRRIRAMTA